MIEIDGKWYVDGSKVNELAGIPNEVLQDHLINTMEDYCRLHNIECPDIISCPSTKAHEKMLTREDVPDMTLALVMDPIDSFMERKLVSCTYNGHPCSFKFIADEPVFYAYFQVEYVCSNEYLDYKQHLDLIEEAKKDKDVWQNEDGTPSEAANYVRSLRRKALASTDPYMVEDPPNYNGKPCTQEIKDDIKKYRTWLRDLPMRYAWRPPFLLEGWKKPSEMAAMIRVLEGKDAP